MKKKKVIITVCVALCIVLVALVRVFTPYLGRPVSAWPFQQIAQWEKEQQNLCWVLYRANAYFPDKGYMQLFDTYNTAKPSTRYYLVY